MAQVTPWAKPDPFIGCTTYKCVTAATHVVQKFQTATNMAYHVVADVVSVAADNFDETFSARIIGTFQNDDGTLTQVGSTTAVHDEDTVRTSDAATFAVSGTEIRVTYASGDTTPMWISVRTTVQGIGEQKPHAYGDADNNPT